MPDRNGHRPGPAGLAPVLERWRHASADELVEAVAAEAASRADGELREDVSVVALRR